MHSRGDRLAGVLATLREAHMKPTGIIVHHTGSTRDDLTVAEIRKVHITERGWRDIGYHYVVRRRSITSPDWVAEPGRPETEEGAHCRGHNDTIGVSVAGNYEQRPLPPKARDALVELLASLCARYRWSPETAITYHGMHNATDCPGRAIRDQWQSIIADVAAKLPRGSSN